MKKRTRRIPWNKGKQFCPKMHDTFICGRTKRGNCKQCLIEGQKAKNKNIPTGPKPEQICSNGHDKTVVGQYSNGRCKECKRLYDKDTYVPSLHLPIQFCPKGHDTFIVGRCKSNKGCKECARIGRKIAYHKNIDMERKKAREKSRKNKEQIRNTSFIREFGITVADYDQMFKNQNGKCPGCTRSQEQFKKRFAVDHDHKTGKVRGLLCTECNLLLGCASDNPETLKRLTIYLEKGD